jgi:hypothetical protein
VGDALRYGVLDSIGSISSSRVIVAFDRTRVYEALVERDADG